MQLEKARYILFAGEGVGGMGDAKFTFDDALGFDYYVKKFPLEKFNWVQLFDTKLFTTIDDRDEISDLIESMRLKGKHIKNADLHSLPVGTKFYVENGCWEGKIIKIDDEKYLHIEEVDRTIKLRKGYNPELHITIR
jgi:hypothetical protein